MARTWVYTMTTTYIDVRGFAPTRAELALLTGVSVTTVTYHLRCLERMGRLKLIPRVSRGIVVQ